MNKLVIIGIIGLLIFLLFGCTKGIAIADNTKIINIDINYDTNWQTSWNIFDANIKATYGTFFVKQTDGNAWYYKKTDFNYLAFLTDAPIDGNQYGRKNGVWNIITAGASVDTNWQTSWSLFDLNMKATYPLKSDVNTWGDIRYQPKGTYATQDTNTQTANWTNSTGTYLIDLNMGQKNIIDINAIKLSDANYAIYKVGNNLVISDGS